MNFFWPDFFPAIKQRDKVQEKSGQTISLRQQDGILI
jgi:hypothetical protein